MQCSVVVLGVLALELVGGSLFDRTGMFFQQPWFLATVLLFAVLQCACLVTFPPHIKKVGFYLCHVGAVLVIVGAFMGFIKGRDVTFSIPVDPQGSYGEVQTSDGEFLRFGFNIGIQSFAVERTGGEVTQYSAQMRLIGDTDEIRTLAVNKPVSYGGWKFYLMDYEDSELYLSLHAKSDPGNAVFASGLWLIIAGTAVMCLRIFDGKRRQGT